MNFEKLINIREDKELSQREMADILNISKSQYARWETGEQVIPLTHLNNFCNKFNYSMDYILNISSDLNNCKNIYVIDKKIIGSRIRELRISKSLTQEELARELNTSHSTISYYENGKTLILTSFAYQIALKYNMSIDWLCGRK